MRLVLSSFAAALIIFAAAVASAQESTITFPVAELGNCGSKSECHAYCDDLAHVKECIAFAESHGLMSAGEAKKAREFERLGGKGPGGCTSKDECEKYCEDTSHMRQCLDFAKQSGMMSGEELQEAEKVATYVEAGGKMPGGCRGEKECRAYCEDIAHADECVAFATKAGFMSEKEAEMFKKTGGKGPGGCQGRACEAYCKDEQHREACVAFAMEHDLMSEEDKQRMEEGRAKAKEALEKAPPKVLECIAAVIGQAKLDEIRQGRGFVGLQLGEILPKCFREVMGNPGERGPFGAGSDARECMRQVFGADFEEKMRSGELDPGARDKEIRECMAKQMGEGFLDEDGTWKRPEAGQPHPGEQSGPSHEGENRDRGPLMRFFDEKRPEGMPGPGDHDKFEAEMRARYGEQFDARRKEIEEKMRSEIESQMRSGDFDRSKLPADFRPEGMFPPPESMRRPHEGEGTMPPPGAMPPPSTEGGMPPPSTDGSAPPPPTTESAPPPPPPSEPAPTRTSEPVSLYNQFVANAITIFQSFLGGL